MEIDHYEQLFDSTYLRWFDLNGSPALVRIEKVERLELTLRGGAKKKAPVATLALVKGEIEHMKPLVLNRTNAEAIAALHGNRPAEWTGKEIVLFQTTTKLKGVEVNCIRIRGRK